MMKDNFSRQSGGYKTYRPVYPSALFQFIFRQLAANKLAWDAGTGNGQTASVLAGYFDEVIATDISASQLQLAPALPNVRYRNEPADNTSIEAATINLVTVSQALHWFPIDKFYAEVRRVAAPGAIIAVWTYSLLKIRPAIDALISNFHFKLLADHWDPERKHVDNGYTDIAFPFAAIPAPKFQIETDWTLQELEGYINTWSGVQKFISTEGYNPVDKLIENIQLYWPPRDKMHIEFPLHVKIGRVH